MPKRSRFMVLFEKQHGKRTQTLLQSGWQHLYHIYWSLWRYLSWKKSLLKLCQIFRLFVQTLTPDDKYSLLKRDNLTQPIHVLVPEKQNTFSQFLSPFLKSTLNFQYFQRKDDPHSRCISEITDSEKGYWIKV